MTNSTKAPIARATAPWPRQTPTTASGGTSEIAIATPGSTAATSRRANATDPANPVATAEIRSTRPGDVRLAIWLSLSRFTPPGITSEKTTPITITTIAPVNVNPAARRVTDVLRRTMPKATPMIGVDSGAMIMAPITVAVESDTTPAVAITADRTSIVQKADFLDWASPEARSRSAVNSSRVRR